jgi:glyoxylase-like metal-dependent hydrolase (beta-lactamase superfamily II)
MYTTGPNTDTVLFTGDHLAYDVDKDGLDGFKSFNHGNVEVQAESIEMLATSDLPFTWLLPGHGRMITFESVNAKNREILKAAQEFAEEDGLRGMLNVGFQQY